MNLYPSNPNGSVNQYFQHFSAISDGSNYRKQSDVSWSFDDGGTGLEMIKTHLGHRLVSGINLKAGTAIITATSANDGVKSSTITIG